MTTSPALEKALTAEMLREILHYDPASGLFTWRKLQGHMAAGSRAGSIDNKGYIKIRVNTRYYKAHRLAWLYMTGEWPSGEIDHANTLPADNRWTNLRNATRAQNNANRPLRPDNKTGHKGVMFRNGKWAAVIIHNRVRYHLGLFDTAESAGMAYRSAARDMYGEFARLGDLQ